MTHFRFISWSNNSLNVTSTRKENGPIDHGFRTWSRVILANVKIVPSRSFAFLFNHECVHLNLNDFHCFLDWFLFDLTPMYILFMRIKVDLNEFCLNLLPWIGHFCNIIFLCSAWNPILINLTRIHELYQFIDVRTSAQIMLIVCDKVTLFRPLFYVLELFKVDNSCKVTAKSTDWRFNFSVNATVSFHCVDVVKTVFTVHCA